MTNEILIAGFGGQGILFAGKFLAYDALLKSKEVSWLPSYGPEMRGGTANCCVIVSDEPIGSPIISEPDILIAMNLPSLDKYEDAVKPGGKIFTDSALIQRKVKRTDVSAYYIPATRLASENGLKKLANIIMIGCFMKNTELITYEQANTAMLKVVPAKKPELLELNMKAVQIGYDYKQ